MASVPSDTPTNAGRLNSDGSSIGRDCRSSIATKAANSATAPTSDATITVLPQPSALPRRRPNTSRNDPAAEVTSPPGSIPRDCSSRYSRIRRSASVSATAPTGTFTKKIHSQPSPSVSAPPTRGPTATAAPTVEPQAAIAVPNSRPRNSCAMSASEVANMAAPPTPWRPRARLSRVELVARPHRSEATVKTRTPSWNMRLRPSRSASDPTVSMRADSISVYASTTHWRLVRLALKSRWMLGSATFTIVMSTSSMNVATQTARRVHHFRSMTSILKTVVRPLGALAPLEGRSADRVRVPAHEHRDDQLGLDPQSLLERAADAEHQALLVGPQGALRQLRDLAGELLRAPKRLAARHHLVRQPDPLRLGRIHAAAGDYQL